MARPRTTKLKEPVRMRFKKLANGSKSIYLDIYVDGNRSYEYLKLYILPELNANIKEQNRTTMAAAEKIKSQRIIQLTEDRASLRHVSKRAGILVSDWLDTYKEDREKNGARGMKIVKKVKRLLEQYRKGVRMKDVNKEFILGFIDFLRNDYRTAQGKPIAPYTQRSYFGIFNSALNAAVQADVIPDNPVNRLTPQERIKAPESKREYLSIDEIRTLIATECSHEIVKRAFMFSCYCGLRLSDVYALKWKDLVRDGDIWRVGIVMKKTATPNYLPLSKQATAWMPERSDAADSDNVFARLPKGQYLNDLIKAWAKEAGLSKHVTFHTSRHTFATMLLTLGADLYTVSKLLGHANVKTTQIYGKIVDQKKDDAVSRIDKAFE